MGRRAKSQEKAERAAAERTAREAMAINVGIRLKWTRLALKRMQQGPPSSKEFAQSIGLSKGRYSNFEQGTSMLPPDVAVRISQKYGVNLDWLYAADETWLPNNFQTKLDEVRAEHESNGE